MAVNTVIFGDFSEAEVQTLLTTDTSDLEFAWQRHQHVDCRSGDARCGIQHFPSAMLDIPEPLERRVYSPGALSPNIPPNPPTSPVEGEDGDPRMSSKLNVNAPAFVPASLSVIDKTNMGTGSQGSTGERSSPFNPLKESDRDLNEQIATNDRHVKSPDGHRGREMVSSSSGTRVQTVGQVTTNVPTSVSHPGNTGVSAPRTSSSSSSTPLSSPPPPSSLPQNKDAPTLSPPPSNVRTTQPAQAQSIHPIISTRVEIPTSLNLTMVPPQTSPHRSLSPHSPSSEATATSPSRTSHSPTPTPTVSEVTTPTAHVTVPTGTLNPAPKSWASIVGGKSLGSPVTTTNTPRPTQVSTGGQRGEGESSAVASGNLPSVDVSKVEESEQQTAVDPTQISSQLQSLGEQLEGVNISHDSVSVQPRGLINQGNWCYIHAPLQALLSCPGMYNLLKSFSPFPTLSRTPTATPLTDSMVQFVHEFEAYPKSAPIPDTSHSKTRKKRSSSSHKPEFFHGEPFRPDYVYGMLPKIRSTLSYKGRQEDAEEFLGCVLDGLHEEMVSAQKVVSELRETQEVSRTSGGGHMEVDGEKEREECEEEEEEEEEEEWEQVGPKNKSTITRQTSFSESPITELFGGELRSAVHRQGVKDSATVEPFFSLQLDIQSEEIWTVKDALDALAVKETVQMNTGTQQEVEAQKRITLARLPPILILHLKRFIFNKTGGSQKLQKHVTYSTEMEIGKELLAPAIKNKLSLLQRSYRLWAVVYHHGKYATGGHYTCDVCHPVCGGWVRIDDSVLKPVSEEMVLRQNQTNNKVAYLLFYRRVDSIRT